jgi:ferredoxin
MKLIVDWDRCIGAGMCTSMAPAAFELDDDGSLVVTIDEARVPPEQVDAVQDAVACCPVEALQLVSE